MLSCCGRTAADAGCSCPQGSPSLFRRRLRTTSCFLRGQWRLGGGSGQRLVWLPPPRNFWVGVSSQTWARALLVKHLRRAAGARGSHEGRLQVADPQMPKSTAGASKAKSRAARELLSKDHDLLACRFGEDVLDVARCGGTCAWARRSPGSVRSSKQRVKRTLLSSVFPRWQCFGLACGLPWPRRPRSWPRNAAETGEQHKPDTSASCAPLPVMSLCLWGAPWSGSRAPGP